MTVALAAGEVGRAPGSDGVEAEYVEPGRGRVRAPLAVCWPLRFERMSPVRGFASSRGQRNWPGWWWFSRTGTHVGYESWIAGCWIRPRWCGPPGVRGLMARHPVLRPGDTLRLGGETHTVAALGSVKVVLADVTGAVREVPTAGLLADPGLELVSASRVPMAPQPALERLPAETVEAARWWERHLAEVITGVPPESPPGTRPRPAYDPASRSLRQRELAKHQELVLAGHRVGLSTLKRLRGRYERQGLWGVIDHRASRPAQPGGLG